MFFSIISVHYSILRPVLIIPDDIIINMIDSNAVASLLKLFLTHCLISKALIVSQTSFIL